MNTPYANVFIENEVEDQFNSHLDLMQYCKVDRNLEGKAGMKVAINVYSASNGTQKLTTGNGNTSTIEAGYTQKEYDILLAQNRFVYYDEEQMKDPNIVPVGVRHGAVDMFNTVNSDIYGEFEKATIVLPYTTLGFNALVDAVSGLDIENLEGVKLFGFVSSADTAKLRKALKDDLKYVEAFARSGYIGTVAGINLYIKKDATENELVVATDEAVTLFIKKGTEVEQEREGNPRKNTIYTRKYYVPAMTDYTKAVKLVAGSASLSEDTTVSSSKTYYEAVGLVYKAVKPAVGDNPVTKGWYEIG